jgi:hypothetical protein
MTLAYVSSRLGYIKADLRTEPLDWQDVEIAKASPFYAIGE